MRSLSVPLFTALILLVSARPALAWSKCYAWSGEEFDRYGQVTSYWGPEWRVLPGKAREDALDACRAYGWTDCYIEECRFQSFL